MGGSSKNTTNTVAEPWKEQKPYLIDVFKEAQSMYDRGALTPAYYGGNTVAPQSDYTVQAMQMQANRAKNGSAVINSATDTVNSLMRSGLGGNQGLNYLNSYGKTDALAKSAGYNSMLGAAGKALTGNAGLSALGQMTTAVNPYSESLLDRATDQALSKINGNFSQAGRYGSGAHEAAAADAAANLANQFYSNAYDQQMQAAQAQGQLYNQALESQIGAYNAANDAYMQNQGNLLDAARNAGDLYNSGMGALFGGADSALNLGNQAYQDAAALSEAGGVKDDYQQMLINAAIDKYNYNANAQLNALSNYMQLINGSYGGTNTSTGKQGSNAGQTLGNAIGGATAAIGAADIIRNWMA